MSTKNQEVLFGRNIERLAVYKEVAGALEAVERSLFTNENGLRAHRLLHDEALLVKEAANQLVKTVDDIFAQHELKKDQQKSQLRAALAKTEVRKVDQAYHREPPKVEVAPREGLLSGEAIRPSNPVCAHQLEQSHSALSGGNKPHPAHANTDTALPKSEDGKASEPETSQVQFCCSCRFRSSTD